MASEWAYHHGYIGAGTGALARPWVAMRNAQYVKTEA
jgi:hypothetical protein